MNGPPDWIQDAVFYQIFVDRFADGDPSNNPARTALWGQKPTRSSFFGGDLVGIRQRLPHLVDLGVNAIYLNPIFKSPSNHKYDTEDYLEVDPAFGGTPALVQLVKMAHDLGIRVVLDGVFSHTGDRFFAFRDLIVNGERSKYRDWYTVEGFPIKKSKPNYRACGGAPFLPQLRTTNPEVRSYLLSVATHWFEIADIDGWRLDVPWEQDHELWRELRTAVKAIRPDAYLVGEAWGDAGPWLQGDEFDGVTNYRLRELLFRFMLQRAIDAETFDRELNQLAEGLPTEFRASQLNLVGSHDTARLATLSSDHPSAADQMLVFLFTYVGAPLVYYGDEIGLQGGNDPDCRRCMDWSETDWNHARRDLVRKLANLRRRHVSLRRGRFQSLFCRARCHAFARISSNESFVVVLNAGFQPEQIELPVGQIGLSWRDALSEGPSLEADRGLLKLRLEAGAVRVLWSGDDG
jgi:cyclomaltodextrinase / maltogenic alpha-amylase / neopullulanase